MNREKDYTPEVIALSNFLRSKSMRQKYIDKTSALDFATKSNRQVFEAIVGLIQSTTDINQDTIKASLSHDVSLQMIALICFDSNIPELDDNVFAEFKSAGKRSRLTDIGNYIISGNKRAIDTDLMADEVRDRLKALEHNTSLIEVVDSDRSVDEVQFILDQWAAGERPITTGLPEVNEKMFLTQILGYWVVAGESGAGKSALMMKIAKYNAEQGRRVTVASLEMDKVMLYLRMAMEDPLCAGLELTEQNIKNVNKMSNIRKATDKLRKLPISVIEGVRNIFSIDRLARHIAIERGSELLCFDYIQLGETAPIDKDVVRVSTVSRILQSLTAPRLVDGYKGQPVLALSQYNGEGGKARSKGGQAGNMDLAWSSQIAKDADGILHLNIESEGETESIINVRCGKQRNYKSGWSEQIIFDKLRQTFSTEASRRVSNVAKPQTMRPIRF